MPYDIVTRDGITLSNIPDDMPSDAPQLRQLVQRERMRRRQSSPEFQQKVAAQREADRAQFDPTADMNWGERALANVGAGVDDLLVGARQLFGGASTEEVEDKRALDQRLAEATTGGKALQVAGNVLPTLAVPAGGFLRAAKGAAGGAKALLTGSRLAPAAAAPVGLGGAVADAALAGAATGALMPVGEGESRLLNTGVGAAGGAVLPLGVAGARKGYEMFTKAGASQRVARDLGETLGENTLRQTIGDLQTHYPGNFADVPLSTAAIAQRPELARLERTSRVNPRQQPQWYQFDKDQGAAAWRAVDDATQEADELGQRFATRQQNWDDNWTRAEKSLRPRNFASLMGQLKTSLDQAAQSPEAMNPRVMAALKQIDDAVVSMGDNFTPAHLQKLRAELNGKAEPMSPSALKAAPRESAAIRSLIRELDDILNQSTGGRWDKVKEGYARDTDAVHAAKAASLVREAYVDRATGRVRAGSVFDPDVPQVTATSLGRAMDAARKSDKSLALSDRANKQLTRAQEALRRQAITQGVARTATAGGGSNTAADLAGTGLQATVGQGWLGQAATDVARGLRSFGQGRYDDTLGEALRNPQEMIKLLELRLQQGQPLSESEKLLLNALRGASVGIGTSTTAALAQ